MKKTALIVMFGCLALTAGAQTWSEWFRQKKTQIKYLTTQIAAYKVYGLSVEKGYRLAKDGLTTIHQSKQGDVTLHDEHFTSLKSINPTIRRYWKVAEIVALEIRIAKACSGLRKRVENGEQLSKEETQYVKKVTGDLLRGCVDELESLQALVTDNKAAMRDDARISRIDDLLKKMQEDEAFVKDFDTQIKLLAFERRHEAANIGMVRSLFGVRKKKKGAV